MRTNIGIIGLGKLGRLRYELLSDRNDVGRVTFFDPEVAHHEGVAGAMSADEILQDPGVDAVVISVPNVYAKDYVRRAMEYGKHVLCEKPPGVSYEEAKSLAGLQREYPGQVLKFAFNHRYLSHVRDLQQLVKSKTYGEVLWVRGVYGKGYDNDLYNQWRSKRSLAGGGVLIDQGIHMLDLILELVGEAEVEHACVDHLKWLEADVEDNVFALLRSGSGVPISFHSSMVHWPHTFCLDVGTEKALLRAEGVKSSTRSYGDEQLTIHCGWRDNAVEVHRKKHNEQDFYTLRKECEEWIWAVQGRGEVEQGTVADAVRVMKAVSDIYSYEYEHVKDQAAVAAA